MRIEIDPADLRPIIAAAVRETLEQLEANRAKLGDRLAAPEAESATLIGVPKHVLRDARLRGEIAGARVGKKIVYRRDELLRFLASKES